VPAPTEAAKPRFWANPYAWVSTTYFAEGFPYAVVNNLAEILFKELGASLQAIGLTAIFHLPWNLKFLWGPFVDEYETKRRWLIAIEIALSAMLLLLAFTVSATELLSVMSAVFLAMAVLSATHDVAIDGYYLEALDEREQSRFVGFRAGAYRVAALAVRGPLVVLIGVVGWGAGLFTAALVFAAITAFHLACLPRAEAPGPRIGVLVRRLATRRVLIIAAVLSAAIAAERRFHLVGPHVGPLLDRLADAPGVRQLGVAGTIGVTLLALLALTPVLLPFLWRKIERSQSHYAQAFVTFRDQPRIGRALAFVMLFRTGESFLEKMRYPFLSDAAKMSLETYGFVNGTLGLFAVVVATMLGGWLIAKDGLRRWIWPLMLAQNVLNLLYAGVGMMDDPSALGVPLLAAVITVEHFGAGLGTAVLMVYIMRLCDSAHKAGHMAIVTALMSVGFTAAGAASGFLAAAMGYGPYFAFTFVATIPSMILVFFVPHLDGREGSSPGPAPHEDARSG
jgi:PAT family beta-lactamase induction signal transducer AmpG